MQRGLTFGKGSALFTFFLWDLSGTGRSGDELGQHSLVLGRKDRTMNDGVRLWEAV